MSKKNIKNIALVELPNRIILEELLEDILDVINSENSGLGHQQRLNEIERLINEYGKSKQG